MHAARHRDTAARAEAGRRADPARQAPARDGAMAPRVETGSQFDAARLTGGDLGAFRHGSMLYMYLENFVTYDEVEIYPGPYMNMVMGPNGTGKSSMVAAMALGLGWHPAVLGRSKDVAEFIKYNTDRSVIETVLRVEPGPPAAPDFDWEAVGLRGRPECGFLAIRRVLTSAADEGRRRSHTDWLVNGQPVRHRDIQALVRWFNIQIDNLCQFLPQDRVAEFARMTPVELLLETEKAAAAPEVAEMHQTLVALRREGRAESATLAGQQGALAALQKQAAGLEAAVQRHRDYEQHRRMIGWCEQKRPWLLYNQAREAYLERRARRDEARARFDAATADVEPLRVRRAALLEQIRAADSSSSRQARARLEARARALDKLVQEQFDGRLAQDVRLKRAEVYQVRQQRERKRADMARLRQEIQELEATAQQDPAAYERAVHALAARLGESNRSIAALDQEVFGHEGARRDIQREAEGLGQELRAAEGAISALEDVAKQRFLQLRRKNPPAASAYLWLQENRQRFQAPILGPICMELGVKDPAMGRMVENCIGVGVLMSFVTTDDETAEQFLQLTEREHKWRLNMVVVSPRAAAEIVRHRPALHGELRAAGFDSWAFDHVSAPEAIRYALVDAALLHLIPVAARGLGRPLEALPAAALAGIRKLVTAEYRFEVNNSRYSAERVIKSHGLRPADFLGASVDEGRRGRAQAALDAVRISQRACEARMRELLERAEPARAALERARQAKQLVEEERKEALRVLAAHRTALSRREAKKAKLIDMAGSLAELDEEPLKADLRALFVARKQAALDAAQALLAYKAALCACLEGQLVLSLASSEAASVGAEIEALLSQNEGLRAALEAAEGEARAAKEAARGLLEQANRQTVDDELKVHGAWACRRLTHTSCSKSLPSCPRRWPRWTSA